MRIDHIAIWTNDLEKVLNFYLKYFCCKAGEKYENPQKQFSSYFLTFSNGVRIELMKRTNLKNKENTDTFGLAHFAIHVGTKAQVDNLTTKLANDGYIIDGLPRITGDGCYESVVCDPENNKIELTAIENYKISAAKEDDLKAILYLQKCCYLFEAEIYNDYTIPPLTQTITDIKHDFENQTILKLEFNHIIIGSIRAYAKKDTCYIGKLIVAKDYQNMGFGRLLIEAIEKRFEEAKYFELFTGSKSEKNLYLYHKLGYKDIRDENMNGMSMRFLEKING